MPVHTPSHDDIALMSIGQFKALAAGCLKHVPDNLPKGFAQYLVDSGKIGPAIDAVVGREFASWAFAHSRLQSLTMSWRDVPASQPGTIGEWILGHQHHCTYESEAAALQSARFLRAERRFPESERMEPHFYRISDVAPDMLRLVACFGGKQKLRGAAVNPLQVLQNAWHPGEGWWPRFESRRTQQLIFVGMIGVQEFVFMRMEWHAHGEQYAGGTWSIKECIIGEDQAFQPGQILVFSKHVGY